VNRPAGFSAIATLNTARACSSERQIASACAADAENPRTTAGFRALATTETEVIVGTELLGKVAAAAGSF
jgi:hypothetical protein